jgi:5-methylcytosine-specific restriction endonuclease McrA
MKWSKANPEIVKANIKNWHLANKEYCKIVYGAKQKAWINNNRDKVRAKDARRHAAELKRTPKRLTSLQYQQIQIFYKSAVDLTKEFNIKMEVDHIVPLQGKNVSGLHVPWNLQILTKVDNMKKGNR